MFTYTRLSLSLVLVWLLTACLPGGAPTPEITLYPDFYLRFDRAPCFGFCPVYSFTLMGDGHLTYQGQKNVTTTGTHEAVLTQAQMQAVVDAFEKADFFELANRYDTRATDLPAITLTLTLNGETKSVYHYGLTCGSPGLDQAPQALCDLEATLEAIPEIKLWTKGE